MQCGVRHNMNKARLNNEMKNVMQRSNANCPILSSNQLNSGGLGDWIIANVFERLLFKCHLAIHTEWIHSEFNYHKLCRERQR